MPRAPSARALAPAAVLAGLARWRALRCPLAAPHRAFAAPPGARGRHHAAPPRLAAGAPGALRAEPLTRRAAALWPLPFAPDGALSLLGGLAQFAAKAYGLLAVLLFVLQRKLLYIPSAEKADPCSTGGELVRFKGSAGEQLAGVYFAPPADEAPVLVFFHGNGDQLGWGPAYLGQRLRQEFGVGFFGVEYPGYGLAEGSPTEASIVASGEEMVRHFCKKFALADGRIVLVGHSLGAAAATELARRGLGSRLILMSPFLSLNDMACTLYPFLTPLLRAAPFFLLDKWDNAGKLPSLECPILVIHGTQDEIVPFEQGKALAALSRRAAFCPAGGCGHNDLLDFGPALREACLFAQGGARR
ncbi:unnamed protein product [Prorocentrum cordatum]|uniref:AB hydrolase-1 domain-containing protein n=1 Tax=Prorocentrum cordatum TaxID=2364126 RepID=A0ABN9WF42_9DINO|nr:unnamed protein product [Polarella glacialis]